MERKHRALYNHQERYKKKDEFREQVMRATDKTITAPQPFRFRHISEQDRVADVVKERRPFEKEVYNAGLITRPDFFRKTSLPNRWVSPKRFIVSTTGGNLHKISGV